MKSRFFIIFTIFSLILIPILANETFAQNTNSSENEVCVPPLMEDKSTGQCIPICGEGYTYNGIQCIEEKSDIPGTELGWIATGIIAGIVVAFVGIVFTFKGRKDEQRKKVLN